MGNFFWAAHDFGQVKLAQNWLWEAIGPSAPLNYPLLPEKLKLNQNTKLSEI